MVNSSIRRIAGFCLMSMITLSCDSSEDERLISTTDPEKVLVTDSLLEQKPEVNIEFIRAAHILIAWDTAAEDKMSDFEEKALELMWVIEETILSGEATFEEMAVIHSHCYTAADSGRLPAFTSGGISEELDSIVSNLEPGEISGIIRTRFGYHLVKRLDF